MNCFLFVLLMYEQFVYFYVIYSCYECKVCKQYNIFILEENVVKHSGETILRGLLIYFINLLAYKIPKFKK